MKTKKFIMTVALAAMALAASAQSLKVSSAFEQLNRGNLKKAKQFIDEACEHENTKDDAKTWCYKSLIYARIGGETTNAKSKYKDLAADWAEQASQAALECKRLDTKNEYANKINEVFSFVGQDFYIRSTNAYNDRNYSEAQQLAEKSTEMFTNAGKGQFASDALYIAGLSAYAQHDTANVKKYFNQLTRRKTDKNFVYTTLFGIAKSEGDNAGAMKVATNYTRNCKNDYKAYLLMADGYLLDKNVEKGRAMINKALDLTKDSANLYPMVLVLAGGVLDEAADYDSAEAKYKESIVLMPNQFGANFGMGKMFYNRAVDKNNAANAIDPFADESGLIDKLTAESKDLFGQSIDYLEKSVKYIDGLADEKAKSSHRADLANALQALANAYARIDKPEESKAARTRLEQLAQ